MRRGMKWESERQTDERVGAADHMRQRTNERRFNGKGNTYDELKVGTTKIAHEMVAAQICHKKLCGVSVCDSTAQTVWGEAKGREWGSGRGSGCVECVGARV